MRVSVLLLAAAFGVLSVSATFPMDPAELEEVLALVGREDPGAVVLGVDMESHWDGGLVSVLTSSGHEWYVRVDGHGVEEWEHERIDWEDKQVARAITDGASFLGLLEVYSRVLDELADETRYNGITREHFSSVGYEVEYRRPTVEVEFDVDGRMLSIYVDPETGDIIMSEWDD